MTISAFDHPYLSGLVGDAEMAELFSVGTEIDAMLAFEAALARAEGSAGIIPAAAAEAIAAACGTFVADIAALKAASGRDGVVAPDLVRQLREAVGGDAARHVHVGATSQDVVDTALMLRLRQAHAMLAERVDYLVEALAGKADAFGSRVMMGYTRMQPALPMTVADRLRSWAEPLERHRRRLESFAEEGFPVQFGGAVGTLEKLGTSGADVRRMLAEELGLDDAVQWQSQRDRLVEFSAIVAGISGSLGKLGQDVALMAEIGGEIALSGGGGSSAMAHKQNPVAAEALVALGRFNAVQSSGMQHAAIHEQERSGAAWTLEWLILPPMLVATAASLRLALELVGNIRSLGRDGEKV